MGDFNINLLNAETYNFTKEFLLTLQSYSFIPTIDKPTRVYSSSATLIDNIFANKNCGKITSGNIISDISDHYSQFCLTEFSCETDWKDFRITPYIYYACRVIMYAFYCFSRQ